MSKTRTKPKKSSPVIRERAILLANMALAQRQFEILEFRFLTRGASGDPLLKSFKSPGNYAMWERGGKIVPVIVYMNRGRPARMPKFHHYLLQVNVGLAKRDHKELKDPELVRKNVRLFVTTDNNGDLSYHPVSL